MKKTTLSLLLIFISLLQLTAQTDTVYFVGDVIMPCTVQKVSGENTSIFINGKTLNYSTRTIYKFVIADTNPNKAAIQTAYLDYINKYNYNTGNVNTQNGVNSINYTAGFYLQRGAKRQTSSIIVGLAGIVVGGVIGVATENPVVGGVLGGISSIISLGLHIGGISDYGRAGRMLDNQPFKP